MELDGARVVVTGASRGIGAALAEGFAGAGARTVLVARHEAAIAALAERLGGVAHAVDLADQCQVDGLIARIEREGGPVDVLVNNAAVETHDLVDEIDETAIGSTIALNLTTPERLCRQALPGMLDRGRGHIVNVSSLAGVTNVPGTAVYGSTKAALSHFSGGLRAELKGTGIGLTLVEPGVVDTDMWHQISASPAVATAARRFERLGLLPKAKPERLAAAIVRAVRTGRYHVRRPRRCLSLYALEDLPRRLAALSLSGVEVPRERRAAVPVSAPVPSRPGSRG